MLRVKNLEKYKKKNEYGLDSKYMEDDDNYILNSHRLIKDEAIDELTSKQLHKYIDDVLQSKSINKIIYSTNAKAEINLLIKSTDFAKSSLKNLRKSNLIKEEPIDIAKIKNKKETFAQISEEIISHRLDKIEKKEILQNKINNFHRTVGQEMIQNIDREKSDHIVSPYRKKKFDQAFSYVKNKMKLYKNEKRKKIILPNMKLKMDDVYSRLYHNVVLMSPDIKEACEKPKRESKHFNRLSSNMSQPIDMPLAAKTSSKNFFVKNIFSSVNGKEFTLKITDEIIAECFYRHSGGPLVIKEQKNHDRPSVLPYKPKEHSLDLLNKKNLEGNTVLHLSIKDQCREIVEYLLDKGANVNTKNNDGDTPLHFAVKLNDFAVTKLLLDFHAEIDVVNKKNETPVDLAKTEMKKLYNLDNMLLIKKMGIK